ncbi:MAG: pilus assembly protein PilM [Planctomycetes bacterium]|nr:pilus assembly protein PilM [Planctomycetota bacterium]
MPRTVTGIDLGLCNARFLRGYAKGNTFHVTAFANSPLSSKELPDGWSACEVPFKPTNARVGVTGRDVNVRYVRVPRVPDWQLRNLMRFEVEEIGGQSGGGAALASDFNLLPQLPEIEGEDVVLLAMARESLLEAHMDGLAGLGGTLESFTPNAIALYNAWTRYGVLQDETVLVANLGHDHVDVVIARGPDLLFARNLTGGSRLFEEAIAQRFSVSTEKARELKETIATLDPAAKHTDSNAEKASRSILAAAGQLTSLLQSAVIFCKSQVKLTGLKLDRVVLCGGGAALEGLPKYLSNALSVPVELFDPWKVVDTTALPEDQKRELETYALESVVALGLATMASDSSTYGVEILPAATRKKRAFAEQHAWMIAAGVLAVGYLGWDAWKTREDLARARRGARGRAAVQAGQRDLAQGGGARPREPAARDVRARAPDDEGLGRAARARRGADAEGAARRLLGDAALDRAPRRSRARHPARRRASDRLRRRTRARRCELARDLVRGLRAGRAREAPAGTRAQGAPDAVGFEVHARRELLLAAQAGRRRAEEHGDRPERKGRGGRLAQRDRRARDDGEGELTR